MTRPLVHIREVGLRDGLQMIEQLVPTETKLEWLAAEATTGIRDFDVTSFVSKSRMPQFADAELMVNACREQYPDINASVLTLMHAERNGRCKQVPLGWSMYCQRVQLTVKAMLDEIQRLRFMSSRKSFIWHGSNHSPYISKPALRLPLVARWKAP